MVQVRRQTVTMPTDAPAPPDPNPMHLCVHRQESEHSNGFTVTLSTEPTTDQPHTTVHPLTDAILQTIAEDLIETHWQDDPTRAFISPTVFVNAIHTATELQRTNAYYGKAFRAIHTHATTYLETHGPI